MSNLTNILAELDSSLAIQRGKLEVSRDKATVKAENIKNRAIKRATKKANEAVQEVVKGYEAGLKQVQDDVYLRQAIEAQVSLNDSYALMNTRSIVADIPQETMARARVLREKVANIADSQKRNAELDSYAGLGVSREVIALAKDKKVDSLPYAEVYSFISTVVSSGKPRVQLVVPVQEKPLQERLPESLENKVTDVLSVMENEKVKLDVDTTQDAFIVYILSPKNIVFNAEYAKQTESLIKKLEELQPDRFADLGLAHRVIEVQPEVLSSVLTSKLEDMKKLPVYIQRPTGEYITEEQAYEIAKATGRVKTLQGLRTLSGQKKIVKDKETGKYSHASLLAYFGLDKKQREEPTIEVPVSSEKETRNRVEFYREAFQTISSIDPSVNPSDLIKGNANIALSELPDEINVRNELADILMVNHGAAAGLVDKYMQVTRRKGGRNGYVYVSKDSVKAFLDNYTPAKNGWVKAN